jgi:hypothetical protein
LSDLNIKLFENVAEINDAFFHGGGGGKEALFQHKTWREKNGAFFQTYAIFTIIEHIT